MSTRYVNIDRKTPMLLPQDLREWVQNDDLAHFVVEALELLDVSGASVNSRGTGSEQYPPGMMLGVLIYCYANGIFSSRQIERATYRHLSVRYLAGDTHPDHDTLAKFRRENAVLIHRVFVQLLQLAQRSGLLRLGAIALDGTKLAAATAKRQTWTQAQLAEEIDRLDREVAGLLAQAEAGDRETEPAAELPPELARAQERRARLLAAKTQLEEQSRERDRQRQAERDDRPPGAKPRRHPPGVQPADTINLTDPESTLTPTRQGFIQGYNAQLAVDTASGLIVAADVVRETNDLRQLQPMTALVEQNVGAPAQVLADTGYDNVRHILAVEAAGRTQVLCPPARIANDRPAILPGSSWRRVRKGVRAQMRQRLADPLLRTAYALRGTTVEPTIGIIKAAMGFRRFGLRGLAQVRLEWTLVSLALNCRRLARQWN